MYPGKHKKPWMFVFFIPVILVVMGILVMTLWNWLIPGLVNGPAINFWQALGILLLSKILFGGLGSGGHKSPRHHGKRWEHWRRHSENRMCYPSEDYPEETKQENDDGSLESTEKEND